MTGEEIKELLERIGLDQRQAANRLDVHYNTLNNWCSQGVNKRRDTYSLLYLEIVMNLENQINDLAIECANAAWEVASEDDRLSIAGWYDPLEGDIDGLKEIIDEPTDKHVEQLGLYIRDRLFEISEVSDACEDNRWADAIELVTDDFLAGVVLDAFNAAGKETHAMPAAPVFVDEKGQLEPPDGDEPECWYSDELGKEIHPADRYNDVTRIICSSTHPWLEKIRNDLSEGAIKTAEPGLYSDGAEGIAILRIGEVWHWCSLY